jgi:hypothetical protein
MGRRKATNTDTEKVPNKQMEEESDLFLSVLGFLQPSKNVITKPKKKRKRYRPRAPKTTESI